jgi:hypothetical protein
VAGDGIGEGGLVVLVLAGEAVERREDNPQPGRHALDGGEDVTECALDASARKDKSSQRGDLLSDRREPKYRGGGAAPPPPGAPEPVSGKALGLLDLVLSITPPERARPA